MAVLWPGQKEKTPRRSDSRKKSVHPLLSTTPYSWGSSEYLIGEVKLEFSGWPSLEINILELVHRSAIPKHMVTRINKVEKEEKNENKEEIIARELYFTGWKKGGDKQL